MKTTGAVYFEKIKLVKKAKTLIMRFDTDESVSFSSFCKIRSCSSSCSVGRLLLLLLMVLGSFVQLYGHVLRCTQ